jgi:hypothetical protein
MVFPEKQRAGKYGIEPALAHWVDADARGRGRTNTIPLYTILSDKGLNAVNRTLLFT